MTVNHIDDPVVATGDATGLIDAIPAPGHCGPAGLPVGSDMAVAVEGLRAALRLAGVDPDEPRFADTPDRVIRALIASCDRSRLDDPAILLTAQFDAEASKDLSMAVPVIVGPIPFTSLCEHHLLPFRGTVFIGYIPPPDSGAYVGLSKLARLVTWHARSMGMQERFTTAILADLCTHLKPAAAAVKITAEHTCMTCRGASAKGALTTTWLVRGSAGADLLTQMN
jgi:GTP cyclohydrolase IA